MSFDKIRPNRYRNDIRKGSNFQTAMREIQDIDPNGVLLGFILSLDDTPLTEHSGAHNGRPLYITTANQTLKSRRMRNSNAWRVMALLPVIQLREKDLTLLERKWIAQVRIELNNRTLEHVLKPIAGNISIVFIS